MRGGCAVLSLTWWREDGNLLVEVVEEAEEVEAELDEGLFLVVWNISVASYMWFPPRILRGGGER